MTKKNTIIYVGILLLACTLTGITYIIIDKQTSNNEIKENNESNNNKDETNAGNKNDNENEKTQVKEDGVKLLKTYNLNDKIIEEYEITLNGKTKKISATFNYKYDSEIYSGSHIITGTLNNNELYYNIKESADITKERLFSTNNIKETFNEHNFQIIKGQDNKNYLLIITFINVFLNTGELLVFNDNFELLSKNIIPKNESPDLVAHNGFVINTYDGNSPCEYENNVNPKYPRNINTYAENEEEKGYSQLVKIEDNKIYFIYPKVNFDSNGMSLNENNYGVVEERVYTINNNKLEYKVINTYKITSVCQQI